MNSAAPAALGWSWLTALLANRSKLCLDHLFTCHFAHFDHALVIFFARLRNTKDMLSCRYVGEHNAAGTSDTSLAFVIDIDLRSDGCEYHQS